MWTCKKTEGKRMISMTHEPLEDDSLDAMQLYFEAQSSLDREWLSLQIH